MRRTLVPKDAVPQLRGGDAKPLPQLTCPPARKNAVFAETLLEKTHTHKPRPLGDFAAAVAFEVAILALLVLIPLLHTQAIDLEHFNATYLVAPAPPPPPPLPPPAGMLKAAVPKKSVFQESRLIAPTAVPKQVAIVKDQLPGAPQLEAFVGAPGGVPGGVPGGQIGGVLGGVLTGRPQAAPPAPAQTVPRGPVRVGGEIKSPRLVQRVDPAYPPLAVQAHVEGDVVIDAIIDTQGNVADAHVVSGNIMLIQSALEAIRQWKYEPTQLGGEPVSVVLKATLHFHLH